MSRRIPFVKATACGNDFLLINGAIAPEADLPAITKAICDRHRGVGADGVEWLFATNDADIYASLINSDGSHAEVSGNGTRCVAAWYIERHPGTEVRVRTDAGIKLCTLIDRNDMEFHFRSDMGQPKITGEIPIGLSAGEGRGVKLSMGNPQFVMFVNHFDWNWQAMGAEIEKHEDFPGRTNVEFVKVLNPAEIEIRIFERGAGETQSSGTGSCASAVAAIHTSQAQSPVRVISPGGIQAVEWNGSASVFLTGPAHILCQGEFFF